MFSYKKFFFSIPFMFVRCFFFFFLRWIILLIIRFNTIFSLSIRNRYAIRISNRFFIRYKIIRIFNIVMFLLLLVRANNAFFLHLTILFDSLWMSLWIER